MKPRLFFEVAIVALFVIAGLFWLQRRDAANADDWHRAIAAAKADVKTKTVIQAHADTVYDTTRVSWVKYRDRILHDTATPPTIREKEIIARADKPVAACDALKVADTSLIHAQTHEIKVAENPPSAPRLNYYGEALYDFIQRAPVARVGATLRVLGPVELSAAVQGDLPPQGSHNVRMAVVAGVRIRF